VNTIAHAFSPNRAISPNALRIIIAFQAAVLLLIWINSPFKVLPQPMEVLRAFQGLWMTQGLAHELGTSFSLNLQALALSTLISLALSYLTVLPFFRPVALAVSKGRFLGLIGLTFVFTLMVGGGRPLKLALLVFGMTVFFITSMASVVLEIPRERFDHARTLRMGEWQTGRTGCSSSTTYFAPSCGPLACSSSASWEPAGRAPFCGPRAWRLSSPGEPAGLAPFCGPLACAR
jgi:ABC-type nitrate/sulfonate/bicarbonate transport system permease component